MSDYSDRFSTMTRYDPKYSETLEQAMRRHGMDPDADVVPSAAGMPLRTSLPPKEFREHTRSLLRDAQKALRRKVI
jgi:hypothetical protein